MVAPPRRRRPEASLRRAGPADVDFLLALARHEEVAPYLAQSDREALLERIERSTRHPSKHGRYVIEDDADRGAAVGGMVFECVNEWSRIAEMSGVMLRPEALWSRPCRAGRGHAGRAPDDRARLPPDPARVLRLQRAGDQGLRAVGFRREGVRRAAYWRRERWHDGVLMGLLAQELG